MLQGIGLENLQKNYKTLSGVKACLVVVILSATTKKRKAQKKWEHKEIVALVQFIGLYGNNAHSDGWPNTHDINFRDSCADAVAEATGLPKRPGVCNFHFI